MRKTAMAGVFAVLAGLPAVASPARSEEIAVFGMPYDFALKEPADPPAPGGPATYATTGARPGWGIAAWNIPGARLPPFASVREAGGVVFRSQTPAAGVDLRQDGGNAVYTLAQDGGPLPCENAGGRPREFDLFVAPEDRPQAGLPSLGKMRALVQTATVTVHSAAVSASKGCAVTQGGALLALVLSNASTHQTLFYQLRLNLFCGKAASCRATQAAPRLGYFARANPFGIDDFLPALGHAWLQEGARTELRLDLRPRLLEALRHAPPGLDAEPSHWQLTRVYHGQHIWGDVVLRSMWSDVVTKVVR
jgi:hypothetical protein